MSTTPRTSSVSTILDSGAPCPQSTTGERDMWGTKLLRLALVLLIALVPACSGCSDDESHDDPGAEIDRCAPPPLAPGAVARFIDAVRFLYDGPCPRQTGVDAAVFDATRVSVVRGAVIDDAGAPLEGVCVTVPAEPRFGETRTRADGRFEIVVNGGDTVSLRFTRDGRLPSRRRFPLKPNRFLDAGEVALIAPSAKASPVTFGKDTWQIASGETSRDESEARTAFVLVPPGVRATARAAGKGERPLESGTLRITEHTRGERGLAAMPSMLPSTSAYTYASSFVFDEAADEDVTFDEPVIAYVDNFLHMKIGAFVPAGGLGAEDDLWKPGDSGRIVQIVDGPQGLALDADGDGKADSDAQLAAIGVVPGELATLGGAGGAVGRSYMRVPLAHFSGWDFNWGFAPPPDSVFPPEPADDDASNSPCEDSGGSWFECESRTLAEEIPLVGTAMALHYRSDRVPGRIDAMSISIPVTGPTLPSTAKRAEVEVTVLGVTEKKTFAIAPNIIHRYTWNGRDAFGRPWFGGAMAEVKVSIVYDGVYTETRSFGAWASGDGAVTGDKTRREATLTKSYEVHVGVWDQRALGLGGWSLTAHHVYDPSFGVLYLGDGTRRIASAIGAMVRPVAGSGTRGAAGDGGPVAEAQFSYPQGIALDKDGAIYTAENTDVHRIRKIDKGVVTLFAGTGRQGKGATDGGAGDGGPATSADLDGPRAIVVRDDGSVCFSEYYGDRVRCVAKEGVIRTLAGGGTRSVGDDPVPALEAMVSGPTGLALGPDGSLFVIASGSAAVLRLDPSGRTVERVAGGGTLRGENILARKATLDLPSGVAVGPDGSLYVSEGAGNRVRKIDPSGRMTTFAGTGEAGNTGDGGPATTALLRGPSALAVDADGVVFVSDQGNQRIRRIERGRIHAYAAGGDRDTPEGNAQRMRSLSARGIVLARDGSALYAVDEANQRVLGFRSPFAGLTAGELSVPSDSGDEIYVFDASGRHLRTLDALTLTPVLTFRYRFDLLEGIDDRHGNTISIERSLEGRAKRIVAPFGHTTRLVYGDEGMLVDIEDPLARHERFRYAPGGLLVERVDAGGGVHTMAYDAGGLLERDATAENASFALSSPALGKTEVKTGLGRVETYERSGARGRDETHVFTHEDGTKSTWTNKKDDSSLVTWADGMTLEVVREADPRLGMLAPYVRSQTLKLPSGATSTVTRDRKAELAPDGKLLSLRHERRAIDGSVISTYDAATRTWTTTSAEGRVSKAALDEEGRVVRVEAPGLLPLVTTYDARGRIAEIARGPSRVRYGYDASGALAEIEDGLGRKSRYERDAALRVLAAIGPDGARTALAYGPMDDLASLAPPGKPAHMMTWGKDGLFDSQTPPGGGPTRASYDADRQLATLLNEDGSRVDVAYDAAGRPSRYGFAGGEVTVGYDPLSGRATSFAGPGANGVALAFDGLVVTKATASGSVAGSVSWTFDSRLRPASELVSGGSEVRFYYDRDGLLTSAGPASLSREASSGRLATMSLAGTQSKFTHTNQGELASYVVTSPTGTVLDVAYAYDALSRVREKRENGATFTYDYDAAGRLAQVKRDGATIASYTYDPNGNRTDGGRVANGQDQVTQGNGATYTYTARGERAARSGPGGTTSYAYDGRGHLAGVTLPGGAGSVSYEIDGFGRRIVRRRDGAVTNRWLYSDALRIAAELDEAGGVVTRFVYARGHTSPDAMIRGATTYLLVRDHLGSVRFVLDAGTGAVAQELAYDPYGAVLKDTNPGFQPFGFAGGIYDAATALVHFGARDYDPETGSFLRRDPSGFDGGLNLYAYAAGDPVNFVDPDGNFIAAAAIGAVEGAIIGGAMEGAEQALDPNRAGYDCAAIAAAAGKGALVGAVAGGVLGRALGRSASGRGCFVPGTTVTTERGAVPIEHVEVGERVLSRDDAGELTYREVTRVFRRAEAEQLALTFTDAHGALQHLVTTPEHPFHVAGAGWVPAGELAVGAEVVTAEGGLARLSAALSLEKRGEVFNLEVEGTHSYFVGDAQLWVHNACIPQHARDVASRVKSNGGATPSGYRGGRVFRNDGRGGGQVLPRSDAGGNGITYREYDVHPYTPGVNRGAERIVVGSDGSFHYTSDHYTTFTRFDP